MTVPLYEGALTDWSTAPIGDLKVPTGWFIALMGGLEYLLTGPLLP